MYVQENLLIQDIETTEEPKPIYRVLRLHPNGVDIAVIDIKKRNAEVDWWNRSDTDLQIELGHYLIIKHDPFSLFVQRTDDDLSDSEISVRDKNYQLILPIIEHNNGITIYISKKRSKLIASINRDKGVTRPHLYTLIRRWLQRGQIRNTLIPDYSNSGNRGKSKIARPESPKLGRSRDVAHGMVEEKRAGSNVTPRIKNLILKGADEFFVRGGHIFKSAYEKTLNKYFNAGYEENADGILIPIPLPLDECPTYNQFYYWYNKERDPEKERKHRNKKGFMLEDRPINGDVFMVADKPGHAQIDVLNIPLYLAHPFYPAENVGSAKVAVMIDTFSRYVMGFSMSHGNESWMLNSGAILNSAMDKVEFSKEYGIFITEEDWKCHHLAYTILGDNGPMESYHAGSFGHDEKVTIENTPPYRPDLKGIIERFFWHFILEIFLKGKMPGFKLQRGRGDKDPRLDAALTMYELNHIFIKFVIWFNNHRDMETYPLTREMTVDGVQPYPAQVWDWGIENLTGQLRIVEGTDYNRVKLALLPRAKASVDRKGIVFRGLHFKNAKVERKYTVNDPGRKKKKFEVSYDPRTANYIYVREDGGRTVEKCVLSLRREDQNMKDMTWEEVFEYRRLKKKEERERSNNNRMEKSSLYGSIEYIADKAVKRRQDAATGMTKNEIKSGVSENRTASKKLEDERALRGKGVPSPDEGPTKKNNDVSVDTQTQQSPPTGYISAPKRKKNDKNSA